MSDTAPHVILSPDCRDGNHQKCNGLAWADALDILVTCGDSCGCYDRNWLDAEPNIHEDPNRHE